MSNRTIKTRIRGLENQNPERPIKAVYQDWDDRNLWHDRPRNEKADPLTWDQVLEKYPDHDFIKVIYEKVWRE